MRLYEFEGKALFEKFKIPVPNGTVVNSADEAESVSREMDVPVVLKSQVLTGGRGKAGGIKLIDSPADVKSAAETLFDLKIKGFPVEKLLIEPKLDIQKELYIGVTIDRLNYKLVVIASGEGGVDIEEVADKTPDKIFKKKYDIDEELYSFDAIDLAKKIGIQSNLAKQAAGIIIGLFRLFKKYDAKLA
ncbi:MAG TPA: ATP-grasp domain-containing protein, partial [candidate division Zixibacteria bacterium]|nr:ATP-grasp domain-containing protein [candidate division Zixibacteria bacterium]